MARTIHVAWSGNGSSGRFDMLLPCEEMGVEECSTAEHLFAGL